MALGDHLDLIVTVGSIFAFYLALRQSNKRDIQELKGELKEIRQDISQIKDRVSRIEGQLLGPHYFEPRVHQKEDGK